MTNKHKIKCPECGATISYLTNKQTGIIEWKYDKKGNYTKNPIYVEADDDYNCWLCPDCDSELFYDEEDAYKFITGKKIIKPKKEDGDVIDED